MAEHVHKLFGYLVYIERHGAYGFIPAVEEKLLYERESPLRGVPYRFEELEKRVACADLSGGEVIEHLYCGYYVVEVMGYAGGKRPERAHLLGEHEFGEHAAALPFQPHALRIVYAYFQHKEGAVRGCEGDVKYLVGPAVRVAGFPAYRLPRLDNPEGRAALAWLLPAPASLVRRPSRRLPL